MSNLRTIVILSLLSVMFFGAVYLDSRRQERFVRPMTEEERRVAAALEWLRQHQEPVDFSTRLGRLKAWLGWRGEDKVLVLIPGLGGGTLMDHVEYEEQLRRASEWLMEQEEIRSRRGPDAEDR